MPVVFWRQFHYANSVNWLKCFAFSTSSLTALWNAFTFSCIRSFSPLISEISSWNRFLTSDFLVFSSDFLFAAMQSINFFLHVQLLTIPFQSWYFVILSNLQGSTSSAALQLDVNHINLHHTHFCSQKNLFQQLPGHLIVLGRASQQARAHKSDSVITRRTCFFRVECEDVCVECTFGSKAVVLNRGYTYHLGVRGAKAGGT